MATAAALILCAGEIQDALVNETNLEVVQNKFLKAPLSFSGNTMATILRLEKNAQSVFCLLGNLLEEGQLSKLFPDNG